MDEKRQQQIFNRWLAEHKGLLFKVVRAHAFNLADQDDLFQEISLQLWKSIPGFRQDAAESTWIYRVALNTAIGWLRREKRQPEASQPLDTVEYTLRATEIRQDERLSWLYEAISQLNEIDRSLTLLLLDGYSYREMAAILGISESNVGVKINRIKKRLVQQSKELTEHGV